MVGMLQIITYLLCVYLVFKGVEIFQIALTNARPDAAIRILAFVIGRGMIIANIVAAVIFVGWIDSQAHSVGNQLHTP
jgi:hypothetical protein